MNASRFEIRAFAPTDATSIEYESLTSLNNAIHAEAMPDDPASSVEETKLRWRNVPRVFDFHAWVAWDGDRAAGVVTVIVPRMETNQHVAQFEVSVLPEYRRHGLAARLLREVTRVAEREGRRLLVANTYSSVPCGERFMERLGANVGLAQHQNELRVAELNRALLRQWVERAPERAAGFELITWVGRFPEDQIEAVAGLMEAINTMPHDDLDIEDFHWTPDQIRQMDDSMVAEGNDRWTMVAREKSSGTFAGYTDISFNPRKPAIANQGGTAVFPQYQDRGLGRWLKAAMLQKLVAEKPEVERVRTGNAQSNAPMLKINDQLGFRPALTTKLWQVELDTVKQYLAGRVMAAV